MKSWECVEVLLVGAVGFLVGGFLLGALDQFAVWCVNALHGDLLHVAANNGVGGGWFCYMVVPETNPWPEAKFLVPGAVLGAGLALTIHQEGWKHPQA